MGDYVKKDASIISICNIVLLFRKYETTIQNKRFMTISESL